VNTVPGGQYSHSYFPGVPFINTHKHLINDAYHMSCCEC